MSAFWAICLLLIGVQSFYIPRGITGRSAWRSKGFYRENKPDLHERRRFSAIFSANTDREGGLGGQSMLDSYNKRTVVQELALAKAKGDMDGVVHALHMHLKALPDGRPQPLSEDMLGIVEEVVERISVRQLARWMWCLGKMGFKAGIPRHRAVLLTSMDKLCCNRIMLSDDLSMFLSSLHRSGVALSDLNESHSTAIWRHIGENAIKLNPNDLSSTIAALVQLVSWIDIPKDVQRLLLNRFEQAVHMMNARHAAQIVKAFGDLKLNTSELNYSQLEAIFQAATIGTNTNDQTVSMDKVCQHFSMTLLGLRKIGVHHAFIPSGLCNLIENSLLQLSPQFDGFTVCNVVNSLGRMDWPWSAIDPKLQLAFQKAVLRTILTVDSWSIVLLVQGLGKMGTPWTALLPELRSKLEQQLENMLTSPLFHNQHDASLHTSMVVASLALMVTEFSALPHYLQRAILLAFSKLSNKFTASNLAGFIHGIGKMGADWKSLRSWFHEKFVDSFIELHSTTSAAEISQIIFGLGAMGASFEEFPQAFWNAVSTQLQYLSSRQSWKNADRDIADIITGFSKMKTLWATPGVPRAALETLFVKSTANSCPINLVRSFYGLSTMEVSLNELQLDTVRTVSAAFEANALPSSQGVANYMYAVAIMSFDLLTRGAPSTPEQEEKVQLFRTMLRSALRMFRTVSHDEYLLENCSQFSIFFAFLHVIPGGKELMMKELGSKPDLSQYRRLVERLPLHDTMAIALRRRLGRYYRVVSGFDGLGSGAMPRDIAIFHNDMLMKFVEFNGNSHYHLVQDQLVLKRKHLLKEYIYSRLYPGVPTISRSDVSTQTMNKVAAELAQQIIDWGNDEEDSTLENLLLQDAWMEDWKTEQRQAG